MSETINSFGQINKTAYLHLKNYTILIYLLTECVTYQFICNVVYDVRVVQPPSLILPPTLNIDTWLSLKVRQVEVVSENANKEFTSSKRKNLKHITSHRILKCNI